MPVFLYRISLAVTSALVLGACDRGSAPAAMNNQTTMESARLEPSVSQLLVTADQRPAGSVTLKDTPNGVSLTIKGQGLPPGIHGVHLHTVGKCDGPGFESAGAHWNPTNRKHGRDNPEGAHLGDLANLEIGADGSGKSLASVGATGAALADADGTSLVIHADPDDYKTDPSGDSGDRIACAVISPAK